MIKINTFINKTHVYFKTNIKEDILEDMCYSAIVQSNKIYYRKIWLYLPENFKEITDEMRVSLLDKINETFNCIKYKKIDTKTVLNEVFEVEIDIDKIDEKYKLNEILVYKFTLTTLRYLFENGFPPIFIKAWERFNSENNTYDLLSCITIENMKFGTPRKDYSSEYNSNHSLAWNHPDKIPSIFDPSVLEKKLEMEYKDYNYNTGNWEEKTKNCTSIHDLIMNKMPKINLT